MSKVMFSQTISEQGYFSIIDILLQFFVNILNLILLLDFLFLL